MIFDMDISSVLTNSCTKKLIKKFQSKLQETDSCLSDMPTRLLVLSLMNRKCINVTTSLVSHALTLIARRVHMKDDFNKIR